MVIVLFGESCTGKSTIADGLCRAAKAKAYTGKDYLKLAKNEPEARLVFTSLLKEYEQGPEVIVYVASEKEQLSLLPDKAFRVLVTADLDVITERFAKRMGGNLPTPVLAMLEKKHCMFDAERHDMHVHNAGAGETATCICDRILQSCGLVP